MLPTRLLRTLAAAFIVAGALEGVARIAAADATMSPRPLNSEGFADAEWRLARTPGVKRVALTGAIDPTVAATLRAALKGCEVLDMSGAPLDRALDAAARYRPDWIVHGLAEPRPEPWSCPSRALTFAIERGRSLFAAPEDDGAASVARTRELCELRESASNFGARVVALVAPAEDGRFERHAARSCDTASVRALVARDGVGDELRALCAAPLRP